ncbi:MAG: hypothetical protein OEV00_12005 [Acidobacteriota bacterium]|nr:hypothetical protein [Acidobacteriota bacterium]MDH3786036.1 hypothetical protein [Acidobacteriota bacterium]
MSHVPWRRVLLFVVGGIVLLGATPVLAEQIVYFTNGTTMPIRDHVLKGQMVHVDLGSDGFIAFPNELILRIEVAGKRVNLNASASTTARPPRRRGEAPHGPVDTTVRATRKRTQASIGAATPETTPSSTAGSRDALTDDAVASPLVQRTDNAVRGFRQQAQNPRGGAGGSANSRRTIGASKQRGSETSREDAVGFQALPGKNRSGARRGSPRPADNSDGSQAGGSEAGSPEGESGSEGESGPEAP